MSGIVFGLKVLGEQSVPQIDTDMGWASEANDAAHKIATYELLSAVQ